MRNVHVLLIALAALAAGCVTPASESENADSLDTAAHGESPEPVVQEFQGRMLASAAGGVAHVDPETEMLVAPVQREGFILEVADVPTVLEILLEWSAASPGARMFAMVNIPTSTDGEVLDVLSEVADTGSVCMRVPVDAIQPGLVSVMAHSMDAVLVDYVMHVTTVGGETILHADRGHMEVEREAGEELEALPCEGDAAA